MRVFRVVLPFNFLFPVRILSLMLCYWRLVQQKPIGNYIPDFLCTPLRLVIEIDGESHADKEVQDTARQKKLGEEGFAVMRLDDRAVKTRTSSVVEGIHHWIEEREIRQPTGLVLPMRRESEAAVTEPAARRNNPRAPFAKGALTK